MRAHFRRLATIASFAAAILHFYTAFCCLAPAVAVGAIAAALRMHADQPGFVPSQRRR